MSRKRGEAGQLPEHDQQDQVVSHHDAQHGPHEQHKKRIKAGNRIAVRQIIAGIQNDESAKHQHHAGKHGGETVEPKTEACAGQR